MIVMTVAFMLLYSLGLTYGNRAAAEIGAG
jgi:hypothetical protein